MALHELVVAVEAKALDAIVRNLGQRGRSAGGGGLARKSNPARPTIHQTPSTTNHLAADHHRGVASLLLSCYLADG
jgi:hypothetical protein